MLPPVIGGRSGVGFTAGAHKYESVPVEVPLPGRAAAARCVLASDLAPARASRGELRFLGPLPDGWFG